MATAERIRLAQELHDGIAQDLVGVGYSLDLLLAAPQTPVDTRIQLRTLRFTITEIVEKVRREMYQLRQPTPLALSQKIQDDAVRICQDLILTLSIAEVFLPSDSTSAYEITKISAELLRNVVMHSQATSVSISLAQSEAVIVLEISDNGRGGADERTSRQGLLGIRERATQMGAIFTINSDAFGTRASLLVPSLGGAHHE
jgi:NarL family two-component system sensor histidine kinase LiaS